MVSPASASIVSTESPVDRGEETKRLFEAILRGEVVDIDPDDVLEPESDTDDACLAENDISTMDNFDTSISQSYSLTMIV